ncbi:collagen alpha-1(I) chain-like [Mauremys reevesii]|uniref:collagen alpha-1(I) chain-like n=1 Tax=Mauremys reevesii TaxID=260615 RepID=UPI00193F7EED|nr:collagen alpha-1(I) chain-like [Mauremys reevesii]
MAVGTRPEPLARFLHGLEPNGRGSPRRARPPPAAGSRSRRGDPPHAPSAQRLPPPGRDLPVAPGLGDPRSTRFSLRLPGLRVYLVAGYLSGRKVTLRGRGGVGSQPGTSAAQARRPDPSFERRRPPALRRRGNTPPAAVLPTDVALTFATEGLFAGRHPTVGPSRVQADRPLPFRAPIPGTHIDFRRPKGVSSVAGGDRARPGFPPRLRFPLPARAEISAVARSRGSADRPRGPKSNPDGREAQRAKHGRESEQGRCGSSGPRTASRWSPSTLAALPSWVADCFLAPLEGAAAAPSRAATLQSSERAAGKKSGRRVGLAGPAAARLPPNFFDAARAPGRRKAAPGPRCRTLPVSPGAPWNAGERDRREVPEKVGSSRRLPRPTRPVSSSPPAGGLAPRCVTRAAWESGDGGSLRGSPRLFRRPSSAAPGALCRRRKKGGAGAGFALRRSATRAALESGDGGSLRRLTRLFRRPSSAAPGALCPWRFPTTPPPSPPRSREKARRGPEGPPPLSSPPDVRPGGPGSDFGGSPSPPVRRALRAASSCAAGPASFLPGGRIITDRKGRRGRPARGPTSTAAPASKPRPRPASRDGTPRRVPRWERRAPPRARARLPGGREGRKRREGVSPSVPVRCRPPPRAPSRPTVCVYPSRLRPPTEALPAPSGLVSSSAHSVAGTASRRRARGNGGTGRARAREEGDRTADGSSTRARGRDGAAEARRRAREPRAAAPVAPASRHAGSEGNLDPRSGRAVAAARRAFWDDAPRRRGARLAGAGHHLRVPPVAAAPPPRRVGRARRGVRPSGIGNRFSTQEPVQTRCPGAPASGSSSRSRRSAASRRSVPCAPVAPSTFPHPTPVFTASVAGARGTLRWRSSGSRVRRGCRSRAGPEGETGLPRAAVCGDTAARCSRSSLPRPGYDGARTCRARSVREGETPRQEEEGVGKSGEKEESGRHARVTVERSGGGGGEAKERVSRGRPGCEPDLAPPPPHPPHLLRPPPLPAVFLPLLADGAPLHSWRRPPRFAAPAPAVMPRSSAGPFFLPRAVVLRIASPGPALRGGVSLPGGFNPAGSVRPGTTDPRPAPGARVSSGDRRLAGPGPRRAHFHRGGAPRPPGSAGRASAGRWPLPRGSECYSPGPHLSPPPGAEGDDRRRASPRPLLTIGPLRGGGVRVAYGAAVVPGRAPAPGATVNRADCLSAPDRCAAGREEPRQGARVCGDVGHPPDPP